MGNTQIPDKVVREFLRLKNDLRFEDVHVELETRQYIPCPSNWNGGKEVVIRYYQHREYDSVVFRRVGEGQMESKQTVRAAQYSDVKICVSIEKVCEEHDLAYLYTRTISRDSFNVNNCAVFITKNDNGTYMREIEFDSYEDFINLPKELFETLPFWPPIKPKDVYVSTLWKMICNGGIITHKLDGQRYIIYADSKDVEFVSENGASIGNRPTNINIIADCELVGGLAYIFDVMMINGEIISNKGHSSRIGEIDRVVNMVNTIISKSLNIKCEAKIYRYFETFNEMKIIYEELCKIPNCDGIILSNSSYAYNEQVVKCKPKPTVDMLYSHGCLLLAGEVSSSRIPPSCDVDLKDGHIYEFLISGTEDAIKIDEMIRERSDKPTANSRIPLPFDPLKKLIGGKGCYSMRAYHNQVKRMLLSKCPNEGILLDIGTGSGGDLDKWEKFSKVYVVDPKLTLRKAPKNQKIEIYNCRVQDVVLPQFDIASLFFVPLDNTMLKVASNAKSHITIIAMIEPKEYSCDMYKLRVDNKMVYLNIPDSETAEYIEEPIISEAGIINVLSDFRLIYKKKLGHNFMSLEEKQLSECYTAYIFERKSK